MAWAKNGTPDTLGSAGDVLEITDLTANTLNMFMYHKIASGSLNDQIRYNNDSGSNYSARRSTDGGGDTTDTSLTFHDWDNGATAYDRFSICYEINISTEEKLAITNSTAQNTAGAANAPYRVEQVTKWANTSAQITDIACDNRGTGSMDTSSNLSALGSDGVESLTVQDGAVYYDTDLNKSYVLYNNAWTEL